MSDKQQSKGREANAAQPPGELPPGSTKRGRAETAARSQQAAGPDGPDAGVVGRTFKKKPG